MVELAVLDRGPGIPPELTSEALQKWVSFGQHRSSGLGMWIVAQFIAALDGEVAVDPRPGGGLIVRARFPARIAAARPAPALPETLGLHQPAPTHSNGDDARPPVIV
jgi:signal transduction histidine kinase